MRNVVGAWDPEVIDQAIPQLEEKPRNNHRSGGKLDPPLALSGRALEVWRGEDPKIRDGKIDRSGSLLKIGRALYDAGANRPVIEEALRKRDEALGWRKYSGRADAGERYAEIVDELESNGRNGATSIKDGDNGARRQSFNNTDLGNSERFVRDHGANVRYCYPWGRWLFWVGSRWERDDAGRVHKLAKETVRGIYREASDAEDEDRRKALGKHAAASESEAKIRAMLELAKSELPISPDELDADAMLLNVLNGTIDLRSGALREHRREDLITKIAPVEYEPDAAASAWSVFLERVLPGEELRAFVQRAAGYSATGDTSEQCMFIDHGLGANGKSTFQETLASALGDYAMRAPTEMLMAKRAGGVPNDVARLKGARFVAASESEEGRRLAESLVKDLTGQDTISARFMRAEWFDFRPTHKLWLSTNHKPEIRGTDPAIWRRIRLVPWSVAIPPAEQDRRLAEKLRGELPGILAWIVRGCLEWRREGLKAPDDVRRATAAYRTEMDVLGAFLQECCILDPDSDVAAKDLYAAYKLWCDENGERAETQRRFGARLTERGGFERYRGGKSGGHRWRGLELLTHWESAICRDSDPTDPKKHMNDGGNKARGVMHKKGSDGSDGSVNLTVEDVRALIRRKDAGPGRAYTHYLGMPSDQRLEYLVKAILSYKELDSSGWERYRSVVLEASAMEDA